MTDTTDTSIFTVRSWEQLRAFLYVLVPVVITDASGNSPVEAEMLWAWVPKKRA